MLREAIADLEAQNELLRDENDELILERDGLVEADNVDSESHTNGHGTHKP